MNNSRFSGIIKVVALVAIGCIPILAEAGEAPPPPPSPPPSPVGDNTTQEVTIGNQAQSTIASIVSQNTQYRIKRGAKGVTITDSTGRSVFIPKKEVEKLLRSSKK